MTICFIMLAALKKLMASLAEGSLNFLLFEVVFNTKMDSQKFKEYLDTKDLAISDGQLGDGSMMKSAIWDEDDEMIWCVRCRRCRHWRCSFYLICARARVR
jgi:hypothetical protein